MKWMRCANLILDQIEPFLMENVKFGYYNKTSRDFQRIYMHVFSWLLDCVSAYLCVCLLRGEMSVCKTIHLSASLLHEQLSPGEAAGGRDRMMVAVCPGLCNTICECTKLP